MCIVCCLSTPGLTQACKVARLLCLWYSVFKGNSLIYESTFSENKKYEAVEDLFSSHWIHGLKYLFGKRMSKQPYIENFIQSLFYFSWFLKLRNVFPANSCKNITALSFLPFVFIDKLFSSGHYSSPPYLCKCVSFQGKRFSYNLYRHYSSPPPYNFYYLINILLNLLS